MLSMSPLQEEFEVNVRRDASQYSMTGYVDKLNIMSLNNHPTTLTNVSIAVIVEPKVFMIIKICAMAQWLRYI